jgi:tetratricopeptide (TPR) repeat protein
MCHQQYQRGSFLKRSQCISVVISLLAVFTVYGICASICQAGAIYKYTDAEGIIRYTNCPVDLTSNQRVQILAEIEYTWAHHFTAKKERLQSRTAANLKDIQQKPPTPNRPTPYTTLHQGIQMHSLLMNVEADLEQLNAFLQEAGKIVKKQDSTTSTGAFSLLTELGELIDSPKYIFKNPILAPADCKKSFLYTAVGETYRLPIAIVNAPKHHFIRFMLPDGKYINWETTQQLALSDHYYIHRLNISNESIVNGVYLRNLSPHEQLGEYYTMVGNELRKLGRYAQALAYHDMGVALAARDPIALINRGVTMALNNAYESSIKDFTLALHLDPNSTEGYYNRGMSWLNLRKAGGAIRDFGKVLILDPTYEKARQYRELAIKIL